MRKTRPRACSSCTYVAHAQGVQHKPTDLKTLLRWIPRNDGHYAGQTGAAAVSAVPATGVLRAQGSPRPSHSCPLGLHTSPGGTERPPPSSRKSSAQSPPPPRHAYHPPPSTAHPYRAGPDTGELTHICRLGVCRLSTYTPPVGTAGRASLSGEPPAAPPPTPPPLLPSGPPAGAAGGGASPTSMRSTPAESSTSHPGSASRPASASASATASSVAVAVSVKADDAHPSGVARRGGGAPPLPLPSAASVASVASVGGGGGGSSGGGRGGRGGGGAGQPPPQADGRHPGGPGRPPARSRGGSRWRPRPRRADCYQQEGGGGRSRGRRTPAGRRSSRKSGGGSGGGRTAGRGGRRRRPAGGQPPPPAGGGGGQRGHAGEQPPGRHGSKGVEEGGEALGERVLVCDGGAEGGVVKERGTARGIPRQRGRARGQHARDDARAANSCGTLTVQVPKGLPRAAVVRATWLAYRVPATSRRASTPCRDRPPPTHNRDRPPTTATARRWRSRPSFFAPPAVGPRMRLPGWGGRQAIAASPLLASCVLPVLRAPSGRLLTIWWCCAPTPPSHPARLFHSPILLPRPYRTPPPPVPAFSPLPLAFFLLH